MTTLIGTILNPAERALLVRALHFVLTYITRQIQPTRLLRKSVFNLRCVCALGRATSIRLRDMRIIPAKPTVRDVHYSRRCRRECGHCRQGRMTEFVPKRSIWPSIRGGQATRRRLFLTPTDDGFGGEARHPAGYAVALL